MTRGLDLAQARSLLPRGIQLHTEEDQPSRDAASLHALACWALRFSPVVAADGSDGLLMDVSGMDRVYPDERALVHLVMKRLRALGFAARIAVASTSVCAWAIARYGYLKQSVIPPGKELDAVAILPVDALGIHEACVAGLLEVGVESIGDLMKLRREAVIARYGAHVIERLDLALSRTVLPDMINGVRPPPEFRAGMVFDGPTDHPESVLAASRQVLNELVAMLAQHQRGARKLIVTLNRPSTPPTSIEITLSRASAHAKHLWKLIWTRLERTDMGTGVEGVVIRAPRTARVRHEQAESPALTAGIGQAHSAALGELTDTLISRLGSESVCRAVPVESHVPERAYRFLPVLETTLSARAVTPPEYLDQYLDRPTLLLDRPEPADVLSLTPDGPVLSLYWRGQTHRIVSCTGPELVAPEWWRRGLTLLPDRAYYAAQTDRGRWLFLCRQVRTTRWLVQGEWA